jgi:hypothetical protein
MNLLVIPKQIQVLVTFCHLHINSARPQGRLMSFSHNKEKWLAIFL